MKPLTRNQLEGRKEKAVRFTRDVLGDPDRADEIADESLEDYAERRKVKVINSFQRKAIMPRNQTEERDQDSSRHRAIPFIAIALWGGSWALTSRGESRVEKKRRA